MIKQNIFNFKISPDYSLSNFYINSTNQSAYKGILDENYNYLFLNGPNKCGKTFLGKIWTKKHDAIRYSNNFENIISNKKNVFIDNLNNNFDEEKIFHILNHCTSYNKKILITSRYNIDTMKLSLNDLISRLKTFTFFRINQPNDDMLLNILTKLFIDKQFVITSHEIFYYIINHTNRTYEEMINIVEKLDTLSLEKKRQLTIPLIKEIL